MAKNDAEKLRENEAAALELVEREERIRKGEALPSDFNIVAGQPLPEGFENPPPGEPGHFCLDNGRRYNPEWKSVYLRKVHDRQRNPQDFPLLGRTWLVPLEQWCDVPPEVVISLQDAVEERHNRNPRPQDIALGIPTPHTVTKTPRFFYDVRDSAKP